MKRETLSAVLVVAVLALLAGPVGSAVLVLGFGMGDSPCVLCWAQRTAMALVALIALFVIRFGPRPRYLGLAFLLCGAGIYMGVRHSALHLARDVGQGFSLEILGAHTYTWSMFIFWVCLMVMGALLLMLRDGEATGEARALRAPERFAGWLFLAVAVANAVQAFASTGPPPFMGQSDPVRFSFQPQNWVWSLEEWRPAPVSLRGRWAIEKPRLPDTVTDPAAGPLALSSTLKAARREQVTLPIDGPITDLAYDAPTDRFLVTTRHGVYITDGVLGRILRHAVVDPGFSVDLAEFAGAAFLDSQTIVAVAQNKSFVVLRENDRVDPRQNFRFFLESFDKFEEITRSRFATVRARLNYVSSAAFDPASQSIYTISVPNSRSRRFVVSRFDRRDFTLSAEFTPELETGSGVTFQGKERGLHELQVTAATFAGGRLYALSALHGTLLTIDPSRGVVVAADAVQGVGRPTGVAIRGGELFIVSDSGALAIVPLATAISPSRTTASPQPSPVGP